MRLLRVGATLMRGIVTLVVLVQLFAAEAGQLLARQHGDESPADVERLLNVPVLVNTLIDELPLERASELQVFLIDLAQLFLADYRRQGTHILHVSVSS